ncbi:TetR/AcrR family transcriptional regulator [Actinoplanes aureus]|uniref:TetR/AcrR family transcriptional regulator n=1 Tax=Actinoplanes aureus TaxID=2792083 RepID=A0A931CK35_9ACTN|nr:TetR/AcrR family transcriptional regulator [Actinoplanes aureus]MBG0566395.1 TetR/AcrR family transcriptional regulator [Actinoplanes aureus]
MASRAEAVAATRERIARSALRLLMECAYDDVTLADIAATAKVSHQTVLNHYQSKEGAALAAIELLRGETEALRTSVRRGDPGHAVEVLVEQYERFGDLNVRWAMSAERLGRLAVLLDHARAAHRGWLEDTFAQALPAAAAERRRAVNALHAATDVYTWKLLRRDLRLSRSETIRAMTALVRGVLPGDQP